MQRGKVAPCREFGNCDDNLLDERCICGGRRRRLSARARRLWKEAGVVVNVRRVCVSAKGLARREGKRQPHAPLHYLRALALHRALRLSHGRGGSFLMPKGSEGSHGAVTPLATHPAA